MAIAATLYRYTFKSVITGDVLVACAFSEGDARADLVPASSPYWLPWECRDANTGQVIWHGTADGQYHDGARP